MSFCACGETAEDRSAQCARCAALQLLELQPRATQEQIKAAYHLLVKVWHPDRFQSDKNLKTAAEEKLKAINSAYLLLTSGSGKTWRRKAPKTSQNATASAPPARPETASEGANEAAPTASGRTRIGSLGAWLRSGVTILAATTVLQRVLVLACGIGVSALLARYLDSQLSADPTTARVYSEMKLSISKQFDGPKQRAFAAIGNAIDRLNPFKPAPTPALPPATFQAKSEPSAEPSSELSPDPAARIRPASSRAIKRAVAAPVHLAPLITVGMTKEEVIAAVGEPTSASDDKLVYGSSEIDLKAGKVVGWKIDAATAPLRVKLWPDGPVDTDLQFFAVGSTKNDVLVVQGTPTLLADDRFGYGNSEVHFRNNRVVSWKNDPGSVVLRAVSR